MQLQLNKDYKQTKTAKKIFTAKVTKISEGTKKSANDPAKLEKVPHFKGIKGFIQTTDENKKIKQVKLSFAGDTADIEKIKEKSIYEFKGFLIYKPFYTVDKDTKEKVKIDSFSGYDLEIIREKEAIIEIKENDEGEEFVVEITNH